jgi:hypothetical protein
MEFRPLAKSRLAPSVLHSSHIKELPLHRRTGFWFVKLRRFDSMARIFKNIYMNHKRRFGKRGDSYAS